MSKISNEQIIEALERSGYFLESRVLQILEQHEFQNFPNRSYPDPNTGKSREIDIYSQSKRFTKNLFLNEALHFELGIELVIECINNTQPIAFFKRPDKDPHSIFGKFFYTKAERELEAELHEKGITADYVFNMHTTRASDFHFNNTQRNTQYCSFSQKSKNAEWMASHPDALHDTFNKLIDFTEGEIEKTKNWLHESAYKDGVFLRLSFPILIVENELIEVHQTKNGTELEDKNHVVFEYQRYSETMKGHLIDVITESYLPEFLGIVEKDITSLLEVYLKFYKDKKVKPRKGLH